MVQRLLICMEQKIVYAMNTVCWMASNLCSVNATVKEGTGCLGRAKTNLDSLDGRRARFYSFKYSTIFFRKYSLGSSVEC
jgi:hypothetical protein